MLIWMVLLNHDAVLTVHQFWYCLLQKSSEEMGSSCIGHCHIGQLAQTGILPTFASVASV